MGAMSLVKVTAGAPGAAAGDACWAPSPSGATSPDTAQARVARPSERPQPNRGVRGVMGAPSNRRAAGPANGPLRKVLEGDGVVNERNGQVRAGADRCGRVRTGADRCGRVRKLSLGQRRRCADSASQEGALNGFGL